MTWFCDEYLLDYITQVCGDVAKSFEGVGDDVFFTTPCVGHRANLTTRGRDPRFERNDVFCSSFFLVSIFNTDVKDQYLLSKLRMIH